MFHVPVVKHGINGELRQKGKVAELACEVDPKASIHDFRMVKSTNNTNLIFDMVMPVENKMTADEAKEKITELVSERLPNCTAVVTIDESFV